VHERPDLVAGQFFAPAQEIQFDYEMQTHHLAPQLPYELGYGRRRSAGGEHIVDDQNAVPDLNRVAMDLERIGAVFELIFDALSRGRQLVGLPHRNEAGMQSVSHGRREYKSARFNADDGVDLHALAVRAEPVDHALEPLRVLKQRRDVVKEDTGFRKIRHFADQTFEVIHSGTAILTLLAANARESLNYGFSPSIRAYLRPRNVRKRICGYIFKLRNVIGSPVTNITWFRLFAFAAVPFAAGCLLTARFLAPEKVQAAGSRVFELRIYHAMPGKLPALVNRFGDHTRIIFDRHGMTSVGYWLPQDSPVKENTFVHILAHPNRDAATKNWDAFRKDPEWQKVQAESEKDGKLVDHVDSTFMTPTEFSKIQ